MAVTIQYEQLERLIPEQNYESVVQRLVEAPKGPLLKSVMEVVALAQEVDLETAHMPSGSGERRLKITRKIFERCKSRMRWRLLALVGGKWFVSGLRPSSDERVVDGNPTTWSQNPHRQSTFWKDPEHVQGRKQGARAFPEFYWDEDARPTKEEFELIRKIALQFLRTHPPGERHAVYRVKADDEIVAFLSDFAFDGERSCVAIALLDEPLAAPDPILEMNHLVISGIGTYTVRLERHLYFFDLGKLLTHDIQPWFVTPPEYVQSIFSDKNTARFNAACRATAEHLEVSNISVFLPDPEGELMWCIGGSEIRPYALRTSEADAGLLAGVPLAPFAEFLGAPVQCMHAHDRNISKDPSPDGRAMFAAAIDTDAQTALRKKYYAELGPWIYVVVPLPDRLASRRCAVVLLQGRDLSEFWLNDKLRFKENFHPNWKYRLQLAALHLSQAPIHAWTDGIAQWKRHIIEQVDRKADLAEVCKFLAHRLPAVLVSVWMLEQDRLRLRCWSAELPSKEVAVEFPGLASCPFAIGDYFPSCGDVRDLPIDGVLERAFPGQRPPNVRNVGTVPICHGGAIKGLLRIDGAQSLFSTLVDATHRHGKELHGYVPPQTPRHVQDLMQDVAPRLAGFLTRTAMPTIRGLHAWRAWIEQVTEGQVSRDSAREYLRHLHAMEATVPRAARHLDVNITTFRRSLDELREALGADNVPW